MDSISVRDKTKQDLVLDIGRLILSLKDGERYDLSIKKHRDPRSRTANAYYHELLTKYAEWAGVPKEYVHNSLLVSYGKVLLDANGNFLYESHADEGFDFRMQGFGQNHLYPSKTTFYRTIKGKNVLYRDYYILQSSADMNTAEFSRLVDGLIQEIKGSGAEIETMTPQELERLKGYESQVNHH
nr:MAG TPA: protein NinB [Caudoviricetes sp.]